MKNMKHKTMVHCSFCGCMKNKGTFVGSKCSSCHKKYAEIMAGKTRPCADCHAEHPYKLIYSRRGYRCPDCWAAHKAATKPAPVQRVANSTMASMLARAWV